MYYVICRPVSEVRMWLQLPMHFQTYSICDSYTLHDATAPYAIAFDQFALLIDTLAHWFKKERGELWIA